jgi:hypothetical protein
LRTWKALAWPENKNGNQRNKNVPNTTNASRNNENKLKRQGNFNIGINLYYRNELKTFVLLNTKYSAISEWTEPIKRRQLVKHDKAVWKYDFSKLESSWDTSICLWLRASTNIADPM